jgi:dethiobiotin synthetase
MEAPALRRLVILGTGTEVGKTFVAVALARALSERGCSVLALKPIETGCSSSDEPASGTDAWRLESVATPGLVRPHPLYAFPDPISPHLAARRAGLSIQTAKVASWLRRAESEALGAAQRDTIHYNALWSLVETAGGALSPVSDKATNADLARELDPALWLLVAPDALGVLHDLRSTLSALRAVAREPDLVVLSAARTPDASTGTNAEELVRLGIASPVAVLERNSDLGAAQLAEALLRR